MNTTRALVRFLATGSAGLSAAIAAVAAPPLGDFGTAAATAKIAADIAPLDVVGIRLGMPARDALAALKAQNPDFRIEPAPPLEFKSLPNTPISTGVMARAGTYQPRYPSGISTGEGIVYTLTTAPSEPYVWMVKRELEYQQAAVRPATENIVAAVQKKYGPETYLQDSGNSSVREWYFDLQGKLIPGVKGRPPIQLGACEGGIGGPQISVNEDAPRHSNGLFQQRLDPGFQRVWNNGNGAWSAYCMQLGSMLRVRLEDQEPGHLRHAVVEAWNFRLMWSSVEATRKMLLEAQNAADASQLNQARKIATPKF